MIDFRLLLRGFIIKRRRNFRKSMLIFLFLLSYLCLLWLCTLSRRRTHIDNHFIIFINSTTIHLPSFFCLSDIKLTRLSILRLLSELRSLHLLLILMHIRIFIIIMHTYNFWFDSVIRFCWGKWHIRLFMARRGTKRLNTRGIFPYNFIILLLYMLFLTFLSLHLRVFPDLFLFFNLQLLFLQYQYFSSLPFSIWYIFFSDIGFSSGLHFIYFCLRFTPYTATRIIIRRIKRLLKI